MDRILEKAQEMYRESEALEERKNFVEQQISELRNFNDELEKINARGEILASLGRGVFVRADMKEDFFVDIGSGVVVKKQLNEVRRIIEDQLGSLGKLGEETTKRLEELQKEFEIIINKIKK